MTIAEIEHTLRTLCLRHQKLDTELLVTLLTAGGWEDKIIKDAVTLYSSSPEKYKSISATAPLVKESHVAKVEAKEVISPVYAGDIVTPVPDSISLPDVAPPLTKQDGEVPSDIVYFDSGGQEERELPNFDNIGSDALPRINKSDLLPPSSAVSPDVQNPVPNIQKNDSSDLLKNNSSGVENNTSGIIPVTPSVLIQQEIAQLSAEPQSLIVPEVVQRVVSEHAAPPENLPLKPFESTPHVWPFSKYKEVFHGEVMTPLSEGERILVTQITKEGAEAAVAPKKITVKRTGFDGEDEGLIFLTAITLLIILLLLAYMYSNGRI